jgi:hypothetical protein
MRRSIIAVVCAFHCLANGSGYAEELPSFELQEVAWNATDIFVAAEGAALDGRLTVTEVWGGDLQEGDTIVVPELAQYASVESRTAAPTWWRRLEKPVDAVVVSPERIVLFLKRTGSQSPDDNTAAADLKWEPASRFGGLPTSIAFLLGNQAFARIQWKNPGPSVLTDANVSTLELKTEARKIAGKRKELGRIASIDNAAERASLAAPFVQSSVFHARGEALRILSGCGPPALPHLRPILDNKSKNYDGLAQAFAKAGGERVASELIQRFQQETEFWKSKGPTLKMGWWNDSTMADSDRQELQNRYGYILQMLYALRDLKSTEIRESVVAFRDF